MPRINKCIDLLEKGRPVFAYHPAESPELSYDSGRWHADFWADLLVVEFEHYGFDVSGLADFMRGLRDATPANIRTLTVLATLPHNAITPEEVRYNAWQARHALSAGVHGLMQAQARDPEAVKWFVASARYSFQSAGREGLPEGLRGAGGEGRPADIWGVTIAEYHRLCDPWPLNPDGELLLGIKIENKDTLERAPVIAAVPGVGFAEWGPADMVMSYGLPGAADPPYPGELRKAMETVKSALEGARVPFHCGWSDPAMTAAQQVDYLIDELGAKLLVVPSEEHAAYGRERSS